jgi:hypothetical protein
VKLNPAGIVIPLVLALAVLVVVAGATTPARSKRVSGAEDLKSVRVCCQKTDCGVVIEVPVESPEAAFTKIVRCPGCGAELPRQQVIGQWGFQQAGETYLALLVMVLKKAVKDGMGVEFVLRDLPSSGPDAPK